MTNPQPRPKPCHTCRKRKLVCDGARPACRKCIQNGRDCGGYDRFSTFIVKTIDGRQKRTTMTVSGAAVEKPRPRLPSPSPAPSESASDDVDSTTDSTTTCLVRKNVSGDSLQVRIPGLQHMFQQLNASFVHGYFLPNLSGSPPIKKLWIQEAMAVHKQSPALEWSLRALSMSRLGWRATDRALTVQGRSAYARGLQELQKALRDDRQMHADVTLAACRALLTYELYESTTNAITGWHAHQIGTVMMTHSRGPDSYGSPLARALLDDIRNSILGHAITNRRACFFSAPEWKTLPYLTTPKDLEQELYDIGFDLAKQLEDMDQILPVDGTMRNYGMICDWMDRCDQLDQDIEDWFSHVIDERSLPTLAGNDYLSPTSPDAFTDLHTCLTIMNAWALQLTIGQAAASMFKFLGAAEPLEFEWRVTLQHAISRHTLMKRHWLALKILKAAPFCMSGQSHGLYGSLKSLFPLRIAQRHFKLVKSADDKRCNELYQELIESHGLRFASDLANNDTEATRKLARVSLIWI